MNTRAFIQVRKYCSSQMKWLFVAEKNDAAKTIAGYLSRGQSQRVSNGRFRFITNLTINFLLA